MIERIEGMLWIIGGKWGMEGLFVHLFEVFPRCIEGYKKLSREIENIDRKARKNLMNKIIE